MISETWFFRICLTALFLVFLVLYVEWGHRLFFKKASSGKITQKLKNVQWIIYLVVSRSNFSGVDSYRPLSTENLDLQKANPW